MLPSMTANRVPDAVVGDLPLPSESALANLVGHAESKVRVGWKQSSRNEATPVTNLPQKEPRLHAKSAMYRVTIIYTNANPVLKAVLQSRRGYSQNHGNVTSPTFILHSYKQQKLNLKSLSLPTCVLPETASDSLSWRNPHSAMRTASPCLPLERWLCWLLYSSSSMLGPICPLRLSLMTPGRWRRL